MNITWDADKYAKDFTFVAEKGKGLIDLIDFREDMSILDLGCGNGALTAVLAQRGAKAMGIDSSEDQLRTARKAHPELRFRLADATDFSLDEPVDAVVSNAVFHWIDRERQADMLSCVHDALKKGGQFVFEMGGKGNNSAIHSALKRAFGNCGYKYETPFFFPSVGEYASLVEASGFRVEYASLFDRPTELAGENGMRDWIAMFVKVPFEIVKEEKQKTAIVDDAVRMLRDELFVGGKWFADYVRLRMKATRL